MIEKVIARDEKRLVLGNWFQFVTVCPPPPHPQSKKMKNLFRIGFKIFLVNHVIYVG